MFKGLLEIYQSPKNLSEKKKGEKEILRKKLEIMEFAIYKVHYLKRKQKEKKWAAKDTVALHINKH